MSRQKRVYRHPEDDSLDRNQTEVDDDKIEPRRHVMPVYSQPYYVPLRSPRRRRGWIKYVVMAVIGLLIASAAIRVGWEKITQLFQPPGNVVVTTTETTITPGQIHLTNTVTYATQQFQAKKSATVTDPHVQDCHMLWIFDCQPASVTETVTCQATMGAVTDYDQNKPKLVFGPDKTVTITVVQPSLVDYGFKLVDISDTSAKYGVTKDVTNGLIQSCDSDAYSAAHKTQLSDAGKQKAEQTIINDAAAYGFKTTVVFLDASSA